MSDDRSMYRKSKDNFPIIFAFGLVLLGLYTYSFYIRRNIAISFLLFSISTISMFMIFTIWRNFTERYAHEIIYWSTQHKWIRKAVAGGSFSYYEYKENIYKIGLFEPFSRFMSMMIAFLGIATTFANVFGLEPTSPVENFDSAIIWALMIFIIPIILTPIIPIIWAMEDLQLKSWNAKHKTNLRVSYRYRQRFNSFIAIGTLGIAFSLSRQQEIPFLESATNFGNLLFVALVVLVYPIAILTTLYYIYFRGTVIDKIKDRMSLPMAESKLIYRNTRGQILDGDGNIIAEKPGSEQDIVMALATGKVSPRDEELDPDALYRDKPSQEVDAMEDQTIPQKISTSAKNAGDAVVETGKAIVGGIAGVGKSISDNTVGRLFGKSKNEENQPNSINKSPSNQKTKSKNENSEYKYKSGSATAGLWDHDDNDGKAKTKKKD